MKTEEMVLMLGDDPDRTLYIQVRENGATLRYRRPSGIHKSGFAEENIRLNPAERRALGSILLHGKA